MLQGNRTGEGKCTLTDEAYRAIKRKILALEFAPGAHITEAQLSALLCLGKTPVREALAALQQEGLVEAVPRTGYRVTPVTLKDVLEIFALRVLLEGEAVRLAAGRELSAEQLQRLEELCHIEYDLDDPAAFQRSLEENTEFHVLLAEGSGNRRLVEMLRGIMEQTERVLHIALSQTPWSESIEREHRDLLRPVLRGDGEQARQVVQEHGRVWKDRLIDLLLSTEALQSTNLAPGRRVPQLTLVEE
jgi:DNA-binding GntR family transcriptional regulator